MGHVFCADGEKPAAIAEGSKRQDGSRSGQGSGQSKARSLAGSGAHRLPTLRAASKRLSQPSVLLQAPVPPARQERGSMRGRV